MPVYKRTTTKSKRWYYKFEINGVVYKKTIKTARTKRQAEEAELQARQEIHEGRYSAARPMLFSDFVKNHYLPWAKGHHAENDVDATQAHILVEHFGSRLLTQISPMLIDGFKLKLAKTPTQYGTPYAPGSVNLALAHLSGILSMAVRYRLLRENACRSVKRLPVPAGAPRYLLPHEEEMLLEACANGPEYLRSIVQLAIWTGFRQKELVTLDRSHIDFRKNVIYVMHPKWKRDHRKTEGFPMSSQVRELLAELSAKEHLFEYKGKPVRQRIVDGHFRDTCRRIGIYDLTFHALRHTFGTRLADRDVNLKKIARLMGHSNTKNTEIYVHTTELGLQEAVEIASEKAQNRTKQGIMKKASSL